MQFQDIPIQRKLMRVILLTSGAVLLLTCSTYFFYEYFTFRQTTVRQLYTLGEIIAANSTAALAFDDRDDANEILAALKAERHIVVAALYDAQGNIFSQYPADVSMDAFPVLPEWEGYRFEQLYLRGFQPVMQGSKHLGTLYLKSDMGAMYERFQRFGGIAMLVITASFLLAYLMSKRLQQGISKPILALAETARAVSDRHDYSVRALKLGKDELGVLNDAFNHMLMQIQVQNHALNHHKEQMENIVQSMGDAYISLNKQWRYTFVNNKALHLMDRRKDELLGRTLWEVFPDMTGTTFDIEYHKVMDSRMPASFETYYPSHKMWLEVRVYPHEDGIAIFHTNITKYKKAEEEVRLFNQKLEQKVVERTKELEIINKDLEAFTYSISHDLRAPLRSINGYMAIFSEDYAAQFDEEGKRLMNIILSNAQRMGQLIDDLLEFSRLGRKELTKAKVSMKCMVDDVWGELIRIEGDRHIEFILRELLEACADNVTIRQVWVNLVSNAIKYTRNKEKAVIEVGSQEKEDVIIYYVRDNGAGFDMQYYSKLFGVFQRLHSQKEFEGTGVGLAIVQRIVAKHGGSVWADAKPNEGATFYFSLMKQ